MENNNDLFNEEFILQSAKDLSWLYNGSIFDETLINEYQGFVYFIENLINGRFYIGRKTFWFSRKDKKTNKTKYIESDWKKYYGSCDSLNEDIKTYGRENFVRYVVNLCTTKGEMNWLEAAYQFHYDVLSNDKFYNTNILQRFYVKDKSKRTPFSENLKCFYFDEECCKIRGEKIKGENNPAKREDVRKKISDKKRGDKHHQFGKPISEYHKQKLHNAAHEKNKRKVRHNGVEYNSAVEFREVNKVSMSKFYTMLKNNVLEYVDGKGKITSKNIKKWCYNDTIYNSMQDLIRECHISTDTFYKLVADGSINELRNTGLLDA